MNAVYCCGLLLACIVMLQGCGEAHVDDATMLDGNRIDDPAALDTTYYLISDSLGRPDSMQAARPVAIAVHGFSASTWEWSEFRDYADSCGDFLVSQVLLGGHGRDLEDFRNATWEDWGAPIQQEYHALDSLGWQDLNLICSSAGCALLLEQFAQGDFAHGHAPRQVIMIDPIVIPSNKNLSMVDLAGPIVGNVEVDNTTEEALHWYSNRPAEALAQLEELLERVRGRLEDGIRLPQGTTLTVYKSRKDPSADPVSALMIYRGVAQDAGHPTVIPVATSLHVFTRLAGRKDVSSQDSILQHWAFEVMRDSLVQ